MSSTSIPGFLGGVESVAWQSASPILEHWSKDLKERETRNRSAARRNRRWNDGLSVANIFLAAVVGTSVFAALNKDVSKQPIWVQGLITLIAIAPAILTGTLRALKIEGREQGHGAIADESRSLYEDIQLLLKLSPANVSSGVMAALNTKYQAVVQRLVLRTGG